MAKTEPGLVLPAKESDTSAPQTFPGFPGVYAPGEPVGLSTLGLDEKEAADLIEEMGLPLVAHRAEVGGDDDEVEVAVEVKPTPTATENQGGLTSADDS